MNELKWINQIEKDGLNPVAINSATADCFPSPASPAWRRATHATQHFDRPTAVQHDDTT